MITKNSTADAYNTAIKSFIGFGGYCPAKPRLICRYIEEKGAIDNSNRLRASSLKAHVSAIRKWHLEGGYKDPTNSTSISEALSRLVSLERQNGIYHTASRFITPEEGFQLISLLIVMSDTPKARLDRLITAISLMAGHRTSMVATIKVDHMMNLGVKGSNIVINTPAFKTDAESPTVIPFTGGEFCPATWIRDHVGELNIREGWLFGSPVKPGSHLTRHTINKTTKRTLETANITGGKLTSTSFRKTMATLAAARGVSAMAIAAQGSWSNLNTVNKHYVSKALALMGDAPIAVIDCIAHASNAIESELALLAKNSKSIEPITIQIAEQFSEMRSGYWDMIFHTNLSIEEKRGFSSYFHAADKYVVQHDGDSILDKFNQTCIDCGYDILVKHS
jgi:hypothetical protein